MLAKAFLCILIVSAVAAIPVFASPSYTAWSEARNLESIPGTDPNLNTQFLEGCPILSRDSLQLYLASNRSGPLTGLDIWVAERSSPGAPFGAPAKLDAPINSPSNDFCPSPLRDGKGFMFVSNRDGGCGGVDIYITRYNTKSGWEDPVNLGCQVNSGGDEAGPVLVFAKDGPPTLYFSSTQSGAGDLYMSEKADDWTFAPAVPVPGVNTPSAEVQPYVSRNGRELYFSSDRDGSIDGFDIWSVTRDSISSPWSEPFNLGRNVNSAANETRPSLSWDGKTLLFGTTRPGVEGASDIYYSTRR